MIITYFGKQFFKIEQGKMVLAFNPVSKNGGLDISSRFGADLAFVTTNHPLYNGIEQLSFGERIPFVLSGPGSYEVKEIFIKGLISNALISGKKYINTIYSFNLDGINILFTGALSDTELSKDVREKILEPDILFIPIGEKETIGPKASAKFALSLEPKIIIPMDYDEATLKIFLKEIGGEKVEKLDKIVLKKKDLEGKEGEVIVLSALG